MSYIAVQLHSRLKRKIMLSMLMMRPAPNKCTLLCWPMHHECIHIYINMHPNLRSSTNTRPRAIGIILLDNLNYSSDASSQSRRQLLNAFSVSDTLMSPLRRGCLFQTYLSVHPPAIARLRDKSGRQRGQTRGKSPLEPSASLLASGTFGRDQRRRRPTAPSSEAKTGAQDRWGWQGRADQRNSVRGSVKEDHQMPAALPARYQALPLRSSSLAGDFIPPGGGGRHAPVRSLIMQSAPVTRIYHTHGVITRSLCPGAGGARRQTGRGGQWLGEVEWRARAWAVPQPCAPARTSPKIYRTAPHHSHITEPGPLRTCPRVFTRAHKRCSPAERNWQ